METVKATVQQIDEKQFIKITLGKEVVEIPMTDDKADDVKSAFNKLIVRVKKGEFQIALDGVGEDLFSQVASVYVKQLNGELKEVYSEMKQYGLLN